jgi:hypothetical protein
MVAALLRVVHGGVQDSRLLPPKGQPNIEFFVKSFVRAGRFTTQWVRLDFDTRPQLGTTAVITLPRKGQLISRLYLVTTLPNIAAQQLAARDWCVVNGKTFAGPTFGWTNSVGHAVVGAADLDIGGTRVEHLDGRLLEVLDEFYTPLEKVPLVDRMVARDSTNFNPAKFGRDTVVTTTTPLPFWFATGDPGAFLPVDAIQAEAVKLSITFAAPNTLYTSTARRAVPTNATTTPVGGEAYFPLAESRFYYLDPTTGTDISGLTGDPAVFTKVSRVPSIQQPTAANLNVLGDTYIMAEYVYLDRPEANRFRLADIQVPVLQHYAFDPVDTVNAPEANCYLKIPNPTRNLFFFLNRRDAPYYNAPFLATRDLAALNATPQQTPWWPNASPINPRVYTELVPAYADRLSEPLNSIEFVYEGKLFRYATNAPSLFRSLLPSLELRKSPWVHKYYYNLPFAIQSGHMPPSLPYGEANLDKIVNINLRLGLHPFAGVPVASAVPRYLVYIFAETYNIFRVYGGRAGMMFNF